MLSRIVKCKKCGKPFKEMEIGKHHDLCIECYDSIEFEPKPVKFRFFGDKL